MGYEDIIAFGENVGMEFFNGSGYPCHAETSALKNYRRKYARRRSSKFKSKKLEIDILVIRVLKSGKLCSSKPCFKCIQHLSNIEGCRIKNIIYSTENGEVEKVSLKQLQSSPQHIPKWFSVNLTTEEKWERYRKNHCK